MSRGMKATRLYIINNDDEYLVHKMAFELLTNKNKLVRISCDGETVDEGCVVGALFEMCIDELEFIVCSDFDAVINELDYVLSAENYDIDVEFVIEVENGYVYLMPQDVKRMVLDEEEHGEKQ
jgi:hypothetical protein